MTFAELKPDLEESSMCVMPKDDVKAMLDQPVSPRAFTPSIREAEAGRSLRSRTARASILGCD